MALISTRRHAITAKAAELIAAFEQRYGRAPNGLERDRLAQQATLMTRRAKSHDGETREQMLDRVDRGCAPTSPAGWPGWRRRRSPPARSAAPTAGSWSPQAVIETALADVQARKAGWTGPT